jgi:hypothetical protein
MSDLRITAKNSAQRFSAIELTNLDNSSYPAWKYEANFTESLEFDTSTSQKNIFHHYLWQGLLDIRHFILEEIDT